jgi:hypothetical protein
MVIGAIREPPTRAGERGTPASRHPTVHLASVPCSHSPRRSRRRNPVSERPARASSPPTPADGAAWAPTSAAHGPTPFAGTSNPAGSRTHELSGCRSGKGLSEPRRQSYPPSVCADSASLLDSARVGTRDRRTTTAATQRQSAAGIVAAFQFLACGGPQMSMRSRQALTAIGIGLAVAFAIIWHISF